MSEQFSYAWIWWLIQQIPFTRLLINTSLGLVLPLLLSIPLLIWLHKKKLFQRHYRYLNIAVKVYYLLIPVAFVLNGLHLSLIYSSQHTIQDIVTAHQTDIRDYSAQALQLIQQQLNTALAQNKNLDNVSLEQIIDSSIDQVVSSELKTGYNASDVTLQWIQKTGGSRFIRNLIKDTLLSTLENKIVLDQDSSRLMMKQTLGELAKNDFAVSFLNKRIDLLFRSLYWGVALHLLLWLLLPIIETSLAKWRKW